WTWLILTAHTQLRLARHLTEDLRRPWEKPVTRPGRLTPARVRRGFRRPGRPPGSTNAHRAPRHDPGKNTKTDTTVKG
ncbi:MAG TPA: hypothetical protein VEK78_01845, partial [Gemmatimonadales bacterium]|nr:hypothetical protein [Gemmatimonadales bacterium]